MTLVLDNSAVMPWLLTDETDDRATSLLATVRARGAIVPPLFFAEFAHALGKSVHRGRLTPGERDEALDLVGGLDIETDHLEPTSSALVFLGEHYGLTAYDAWYLYLAISRRLPFATRDEALRSAAKAIGVELVDA